MDFTLGMSSMPRRRRRKREWVFDSLRHRTPTDRGRSEHLLWKNSQCRLNERERSASHELDSFHHRRASPTHHEAEHDFASRRAIPLLCVWVYRRRIVTTWYRIHHRHARKTCGENANSSQTRIRREPNLGAHRLFVGPWRKSAN